MAEAALFTIATKILSTVAPPSFDKAYERARSVKNARKELNQLKSSIGRIQAVLLDAERKQNDSAAVKEWIKGVKDVLYDADDLFDEVATDDLLRSHVKGSNQLVKKVRLNFSGLNPLFSNNDIANRVKNIRKRLLAISIDMRDFNFVECRHESPIGGGLRKEQDPGSFVDPKNVVGRDKDKEVILDWLLHDQSDEVQQDVQVIAIVGIGGMGKTTLTQLVYNHEEVKRSFEKRWFACISDTSDDAEVIRKIYQSICGEILDSTSDLQTKIKESIAGKKFLLVLDDVWDDHRESWQKRKGFLSSGVTGSKIIVSTRSESVARAISALRTHILDGLSEEDSWDLFKRVVGFTQEQEEDSTWTDLGKEIVKKCANVPLAINCIASLLFEKNTIQEWESIRDEELPRLGQSHVDRIMPVLKLSYQHLRSNLKPCFAYCSLFPKDYKFEKEKLIELWIAQGYINPNNEDQMVENIGHSYFMDLVRRSFFIWDGGEYYKMHDLIHDLAIYVAGEECLTLTTSSNKTSEPRHVSVGYVVDYSWLLSTPLQSDNRLRSLLLLTVRYSGSLPVLGKQFTILKSLRALSLPKLRIETVPSSIGELKHLRYLDISNNTEFKKLPDSITKLVNLCTLNISYCKRLEVWPDNFRNLINLRHLHNQGCVSLKNLPSGFEELVLAQHLDEVRVSKGIGGGPRLKLDELHKLNLRGRLTIRFNKSVEDWGVECCQPPLTLEELYIENYRGTRIPHWGNGMPATPSLLPKLSNLYVHGCSRVKCLPPFRHIPHIKHLHLYDLPELEYIEDEEAVSNALFIPNLEKLVLYGSPKLKGWSRKVEKYSSSTCTTPPHQLPSFPNLSEINIQHCRELKSMPLCPRLRTMNLLKLDVKHIQELQWLLISDHTSSPSITTSTSCLEHMSITYVDWRSFPGTSLTRLQCLHIFFCINLKKLDLPPLHLNNLEYLKLIECPELELWEEKKRGVDWDSLHKLIYLEIDGPPSSVRLPDCLLRRQQLGLLQIMIRLPNKQSYTTYRDYFQDDESDQIHLGIGRQEKGTFEGCLFGIRCRDSSKFWGEEGYINQCC